MISRFFCLFLFLSPLTIFAQTADPQSSSYEFLGEKKKIDSFDFPGEWPNLEHIDIDATRKYRIELNLTGVYPKLEDIHYKGSIGTLKAKLTGTFSNLSTAEFALGSTETSFDLRGRWQKECSLLFRSNKGDISLVVPKSTGYQIVAKIGPRGKVDTLLKKQGRGWLERHYSNSTSPKLKIVVETTAGTIKIEEKD